MQNTTESPPRHARVVIIGGGVIGCNAAYHLAKLGWTDILLLERRQLTCGTTWHAAGLIATSSFASETLLSMAQYTRELYKQLEAETGISTGFQPIGYLQVTARPSRVEGLRRNANFVRGLGVTVEELSAAEVGQLWPIARTDDIRGAFFTPGDGRANPVDLTMSLAKGARQMGVTIQEGVEVTGIQIKGGRAIGVLTDKGPVESEYVVNCAGMWARHIGKMAGVEIPLQAAEHYYLITEPVEGASLTLPVLEDVDRYAYYREEVGGVMLGLFEPVAVPWGTRGIPKDFAFGEIQPDWDRMMPYIEDAMLRVPSLQEARVRKLFCGPESFTPDMNFLLGEAPEVRNFYVAAGMNSLGILLGGGVGQVLAEWIQTGHPPVDVSEISLDRMLRFQNAPRYLQHRTVEILGLMYEEAFPNTQRRTARGARRSVLHERLARAGAFFGESAGWEYPEWFAPEGTKSEITEYAWGRQNWFPYQEAEHKACRENVILMDLSLMSKFLVQGRDAAACLDHISTNHVAGSVGRIVYTEWLNERGTIEADLTVTRLAEETFMVICSDLAHRHVETWLQRHIPSQSHCWVTDVTSAHAMINVQGPKSRQLLMRLTDADLSNESFPYMSMREIDIGYARALAFRVTYLGELGYELYIPTEFAPGIYDLLWEAGQDLGIKNAGLQALNSLRIEKAYRDYGHDIDVRDTPLEAGLRFIVDFDKPGGFLGKEALQEQRNAGPLTKRFVQFMLQDPEPMLYYGEPIYRDGAWVGYVHSGGYGFTLGGSIGLSVIQANEAISAEYLSGGRFEIEVNDKRIPARASLRPLYDPEMIRVRS